MWSSSKLVRATIKMNLSKEAWMRMKHKLNKTLNYEERTQNRKGISHAANFVLVLIVNVARI